MRKLFELFLSFFRPVPKDVVNTGYMTYEDGERDLRQMIEREEDCSRRLVLIEEYEYEFGAYNG
tara:strand:+ start:88 stop:279 length:192 start_codon:yes stop_codon:yes gene_type:complete